MGSRPHTPPNPGWSKTPSYWYDEWVKEKAHIAELETEKVKLNAEANQWVIDWGDAQKHIAELEAALVAANKVSDAMEDFIDHADYHMRDGDTVSYTGPRAEEAKP